MLSNTITAALSLLFASTALALPLPQPNTAPGTACSTEGMVICSNAIFQTCGSGQWTPKMALAAGMKCSDYGFSEGPTSAPASAPAPAPAPVKSQPTPTPAPQTPAPQAPAPVQPAPKPAHKPTPSPSPAPAPTPAPVPAPAPVTQSAAPAPASNPSGGVGKQTTPGAYVAYSGPAANFPSDTDEWLTFEALWNLNLPALNLNDKADEIQALQAGISTVAAQAAAQGYSAINENYIFALIMQESAGNVHVPTTDNGVVNPGLLQSHNGVSYTNLASITQMIHDGIMGTQYGDGIAQCFAKNGNIWAAARCYNSGSVDANNLSDGLGSTSSYVSDVANRLRGAKTSM